MTGQPAFSTDLFELLNNDSQPNHFRLSLYSAADALPPLFAGLPLY
jgi:hypothetical protein